MADNTNTETAAVKKPAFVAKSRDVSVENAHYNRIGVAFENDDGFLFVKLAGTQVVSEFTLYKSD